MSNKDDLALNIAEQIEKQQAREAKSIVMGMLLHKIMKQLGVTELSLTKEETKQLSSEPTGLEFDVTSTEDVVFVREIPDPTHPNYNSNNITKLH